MGDKENALTGMKQERGLAPANLPAEAAETSSPARQVLRQFRKFVPPQAAQVETDLLRDGVESKVQLLQSRAEGPPSLVQEGGPQTRAKSP